MNEFALRAENGHKFQSMRHCFALRGFWGQKLSSMKPKMFMNEFALRAGNGHKFQSINHK